MGINFYVSNTATEILNNSNLIDSLNKIAESNNSIPITSIINIIASGILASVAVYQVIQSSKMKNANLDLLEANKKMANEYEKLVQKYDEMIMQNQRNYYRDRLIKVRIKQITLNEGMKNISIFLFNTNYRTTPNKYLLLNFTNEGCYQEYFLKILSIKNGLYEINFDEKQSKNDNYKNYLKNYIHLKKNIDKIYNITSNFHGKNILLLIFKADMDITEVTLLVYESGEFYNFVSYNIYSEAGSEFTFFDEIPAQIGEND